MAGPKRTRSKRSDKDLNWRQLISELGPGLVTGASDDDPSGIATYAQVGAQFGYSMLWTAPLTFPLMATVQYVCAKIGIVTGRGLAGVLKQGFPTPIALAAVLILIVANTINLGVDIGAVAAAVQLFVPIPALVVVVPVTVGLIALLVWGSYDLISRIFKWLTLALFAYVAASALARPDLGQVLYGTLVPNLSLDPKFIVAMVAIWGTTISPYLFFYQSQDEVEGQIKQGRVTLAQRQAKTTRAQLTLARVDTAVGMLFSNVVMYFIFLATAATLHAHGTTTVSTAADAAKALEPVAGPAATLLLACALIGSGMLAVPILAASASYAVSEVVGWRRGLDRKPRDARRFYLLIVAGMLIGMLTQFVGVDPITALFWTAVLNGLAAPPLLWMIVVVARDKKLMGKDRIGPIPMAITIVTAAIMSMLALAWLVLLATGQGS